MKLTTSLLSLCLRTSHYFELFIRSIDSTVNNAFHPLAKTEQKRKINNKMKGAKRSKGSNVEKSININVEQL